jgi:hypothetical protein
LSRKAVAMKKNACRDLFFVVALFAALALSGQTAARGTTTCLDENQVRRAMHEEAFRLLAQKIDSVQNGAMGGFDYHIEQAYEKIKKRLPSDPLSAAELEAWLRQFLQNPEATDSDREFQTLIENFSLGMSLEIINTLQYECEQVEDLIARVAELEAEMKKTPRPDPDTLDRALRRSGVSKKMAGILKNNGRRWKVPAAGADDFSAFSTWKKNMTGRGADSDQRLVFDLGDRYRSRYPFLDEFMGNYRRLAETFRRAVLDLNGLLSSGDGPDAGAPD